LVIAPTAILDVGVVGAGLSELLLLLLHPTNVKATISRAETKKLFLIILPFMIESSLFQLFFLNM
jgi:hypothetical protein